MMNVRSTAMVSRRTFLAGSAGIAAAVRVAGPAWAEPKLNDDGLYHEPWFLESLLELADDLDAAAAAGKRFAIMWELRGCPYCRDTHVINFAKPEIVDFVKARFDILQLNIIGAREVVDFDGEKLPEKRLAEKYGVRFTPTFQFFAERSDGLKDRKPREREVARVQGYLQPDDFLAMFRFVSERAYERESLPDYLRASAKSSPPAVR
jgi:thioredoxin-related protein